MNVRSLIRLLPRSRSPLSPGLPIYHLPPCLPPGGRVSRPISSSPCLCLPTHRNTGSLGHQV